MLLMAQHSIWLAGCAICIRSLVQSAICKESGGSEIALDVIEQGFIPQLTTVAAVLLRIPNGPSNDGIHDPADRTSWRQTNRICGLWTLDSGLWPLRRSQVRAPLICIVFHYRTGDKK